MKIIFKYLGIHQLRHLICTFLILLGHKQQIKCQFEMEKRNYHYSMTYIMSKMNIVYL